MCSEERGGRQAKKRRGEARMGAEPLLPKKTHTHTQPNSPLILGLQPSALIDHVAKIDSSLLAQIPGERGGSIAVRTPSLLPVAIEDLEHILNEVKTHILSSPPDPSPMRTMAGGSVANTIRGLSAGFGVNCGILGACGDDEQGGLFVSNMGSSGVNLSALRIKKGPTAQCVCLVDALGNRTMRPCLSSAVKIQAEELTKEDFKGVKWLVMRYGIYNLEVIHAAIRMAKQEGVFVSLDLASFEYPTHALEQTCSELLGKELSLLTIAFFYLGQMVRNFRGPLLELLQSGDIDLCFANEDEARELLRDDENASPEAARPEAALEFLAKHCQWAVVTLGSNGCLAKCGREMVRVAAIGEAKATDATGAGDLFAGGFLYGLVKGLSLEECCRVGTCSGGSVIRSLGGEVTPENWQWMYKQMQIKGLPVPGLRQ
ncbi:Adenosine kinase [Vitis vinifera]|uniref:Adenosine kinase n=1 Tax=Vitis vinifera TaxID=29760 RepID=A0A438K1M8_VITVI|nr:Adenosine kinase [Vitis vinifera]